MTIERRRIIAGNWKMHKTRAEARELAKAIVDGVSKEPNLPEIVLCPPYTSLQEVINLVAGSPIEVGAQNMDYRENGAYTGEISPLMLTDLGVQCVILGHSERRQLFGETNTSVNLKVKSALAHQLVPIVCVGESLDERESGLTDSVVRRQVAAALADLSLEQLDPLVIAYEPVWAIGTGKNCEAAEANRVSLLIRSTISDLFGSKSDTNVQRLVNAIPVLYGGSVKPSTIEEQMAQPEIDGALVGGASLKAEEFLPIVHAAAKGKKLSTTTTS